MVVTFVGFVGGVTKEVMGTGSLFWSGTVAALVVTYFTFLPSFVFIFLGGPVIETTHGRLSFTAPLTAITAAVVGVIFSLAVFFAWKVWWPESTSSAPFGGRIEWTAIAMTFGAGLALIRYRANVIVVIAVCALIGMIRSVAGL
jgi:chromate transporter